MTAPVSTNHFFLTNKTSLKKFSL